MPELFQNFLIAAAGFVAALALGGGVSALLDRRRAKRNGAG